MTARPAIALGLSLVLHLAGLGLALSLGGAGRALLTSAPLPAWTRATPVTLVERTGGPRPAGAPEATEPPARPRPAPARPRAHDGAPAPAPARSEVVATAEPGAVTDGEAEPAAAAGEEPGGAVPGDGAAGSAGGAAQGGEATGPAGPAAAAGPAVDLGALHARLARAADRCYPAAARRFRMVGTALVEFCVDGAGALARAALAQSAGSPLLDSAATDCVVPGAMPAPPEAAGGCYRVPVRFGGQGTHR